MYSLKTYTYMRVCGRCDVDLDKKKLSQEMEQDVVL